MRNRFCLSLVFSAVFVGLLVSSSVAKEGEEEEKLPMAPDFQIKDLEGQRVALKDLLGQGPVLISFWATWCKPCVKELPHLQELYEKYKDQGFLVVAISEDAPRSISKVKSFIAGKRYDFLVLLDDNYSVQRKFNYRGLPYTVLLDKEGRIVYRRMGYRPGDELLLEEKIVPLMEEKPQQKGETDQAEQKEQEQKNEEASEAQESGEQKRGTEKKDVKKNWGQSKSAEGCDE